MMLEHSHSQMELNAQMPKNSLCFAFTCDPEDLLDLFQQIAEHSGFELIERQLDHSTAIRKATEKKGFSKMMDCFGCMPTEGLTAIKMSLTRQIQRNSLEATSLAEVRGLVGSGEFVDAFLNALTDKIMKSGYGSLGDHVIIEDNSSLVNLSANENPYYIEACAQHIISKILLDQEKEMYRVYTKMLQDYSSAFKNVEQSVGLLPMPMKQAISVVSELQISMEKVLNQLKYPSQIQPFSRISLEKHLFARIQSQLTPIYHLKNLETENIFESKREFILKNYTIRGMLEEVCLGQKFWSVDKAKIDQKMSLSELKESISFSGAACKQLVKIVFTSCPREKVKHCQLAYTELKNHFYDFSHHKYQLTSMEDIIPVLIIVVLLLEVGSMRTELDIMVDFISADPGEMQAEKRLLINISESYNYIVRDWDIKEKEEVKQAQ